MTPGVIEFERVVKTAMWTIEQAGWCVTWGRPDQYGSPHTFRAVDAAGEVSEVEGPDPVSAIADLMHKLGFEDLD